MSRMYSAMSGGAASRAAVGGDVVVSATPWAAPRASAVAGLSTAPAEGFAPDVEETPFVEVGGPGGPVYSGGPAVARHPAPKPAEEPKLAAVLAAPAEPPVVSRASAVPVAPPTPRTFPRLAGAPTYLSVTFHDLTGRPRTKVDVEGPDPELVALHFPDHPVSGEYRTLRDEVCAQLPLPSPRVLFFTAAAGESGTTTVLLNLAITLAREATPRVLVVDANVDRPGVAKKFALKAAAPGLAEVLAQQIPLAWAVQNTPVPNLQVLPAGGPAATIGQDLPKLVEQLRQWYDWVLVDGGVWGAVPDRDAACPAADAIYLVSRDSAVDRTEFAGLRGWVRELGGLLRGYIATRA